jgi:hypothetical protein
MEQKAAVIRFLVALARGSRRFLKGLMSPGSGPFLAGC